MSNYIVLIDENGQPYIAHSLWGRVSSGAQKAYGTAKSGVGRGVRTAHKYLLKVGEGAKAQYAYTKEEVDRLMGRGRQKAEEMSRKLESHAADARDKISSRSADIKDRASNAFNNARDIIEAAPNRAKEAAQNYSARTAAALKRHGSETLGAIKNVAERVKDAAGVDERERAEEAWSKVDSKSSKSDWEKAEKAQSDYRKTPLGAIDYAKERAWEIATGQDGTAKEIAADLARRASEKAKETVGKAKEQIDAAAEKVKESARDKLGYDEKERMEAAQKEFEEKREDGIRLTEEREPIFEAYHGYVSEMEQKYGPDYQSKMTDSERTKLQKLDSELTDISEKWWDATIVQMHPSHILVDPTDEPTTLWDKVESAKREYQETPLSKIEDFMSRIKRK